MGPPTIWVMGSYGAGAASSETTYAKRLVPLLGRALARVELTLVAGESDLLADLCNAYRGAVRLDSVGRAIMIHGSLRNPSASLVFSNLLRNPPSLGIVIGGNIQGRTVREAAEAREMGLAIGSFAATGGAASLDELYDATWNNDDPGDAVDVCVGWIGRSTNLFER